MIPWLIFAVIVVPLVVVAFVVSRKKSAAAGGTAGSTEPEGDFAAAEAYEAEWHKADEERFHKERLP